jgi:hypothetical protein
MAGAFCCTMAFEDRVETVLVSKILPLRARAEISATFRDHALEHRTEKWDPLFGLIRCSIPLAGASVATENRVHFSVRRAKGAGRNQASPAAKRLRAPSANVANKEEGRFRQLRNGSRITA